RAHRVSSSRLKTAVVAASFFAGDFKALCEIVPRGDETGRLRQGRHLPIRRRLSGRSRGQYTFRASKPRSGRPAAGGRAAPGNRPPSTNIALIPTPLGRTERNQSKKDFSLRSK